jgi:hypothetical protein
MSDEVKKAAERLRRVQAGESLLDVYPDSLAEPAWSYAADLRVLADAYLATVAADEELPITREWWETLKDDPGELYFLHFGDEDRFWLDLSESRNMVMLESPRDSTDLEHIKTRGQLRRLCAALNIPLQPSGQ